MGKGKISWFKALGMAGLLADELTTAAADGKISVDEALSMAHNLAAAAGLTTDTDDIALAADVLAKIASAAADGRITIREIVNLAESVCARLGIEFDREGVSI